MFPRKSPRPVLILEKWSVKLGTKRVCNAFSFGVWDHKLMAASWNCATLHPFVRYADVAINFFGSGPDYHNERIGNEQNLTLIKPGVLWHLRKPGGGELHPPPCFSGTIRPIILKFGMLIAWTILMDIPLVPEQNIRNFQKNSGIIIFWKVQNFLNFRKFIDYY